MLKRIKSQIVRSAVAGTVVSAAVAVSAATPAAAALPFTVYAPWSNGITNVVGGSGSFYGENRHVGADYYAVDINGLDGGNTDCGRWVRATAPGTVSEARSRDGYGNQVLLNHGSGVTSRYAHMQNMYVAAGKSVRQGEVLGTVGSTGTSATCHLHFVIYQNGRSVPPSPMSGYRLYDGVQVRSNNVLR